MSSSGDIAVQRSIDRGADRKIHLVFFSLSTMSAAAVETPSANPSMACPDKCLAEHAVAAVFGEHRRLIVPQMRQAISRKLVAAHRPNQAGNLPRASGHERALEAGEMQAIHHARRNADDVFRGRANLVSYHIVAIIKTE